MVLYVGYHNGPNDGGGAQLMRMISLYCICRKFNIQYIHCPITSISHRALFRKQEHNQPEIVGLFNALVAPNQYCILESDVPSDAENIKLQELFLTDFLNYIKQGKERNLFVQVVLSRQIIHKSPELYLLANDYISIPDSISASHSKDPFEVHIHHRLGDILFVEQWRRTPNSYFIQLINLLNNILPKYYKKYSIHIHTEAPEEEVVILPGTIGSFRYIKEPVTLRPSDAKLDELRLPNVIIHNNESEIDTLSHFMRADCIIMSYSSFSVLCAILNSKAIHINHPDWHAPLPHWLDIKDKGFGRKLHEKIQERLLTNNNDYRSTS